MSQYTDAELRNMADFVLDAKQRNNPLYPQFFNGYVRGH